MQDKQRNISLGVKSGLVAGLAFGAMMVLMGVLPMIGKLFGFANPIFGFVVHLVFSAIIGATFGYFFGEAAKDETHAVLLGLVTGFIWWILGPITIMPVWLGGEARFALEAVGQAVPSLWGHIIFGFVLGLVYPILAKQNQPTPEVDKR
jgi:hypothetical protein